MASCVVSSEIPEESSAWAGQRDSPSGARSRVPGPSACLVDGHDHFADLKKLRKPLHAPICAGLVLGAVGALFWTGGCRQAAVPLPPLPSAPKPIDDTGLLHPRQIGFPIDGHPWIAHVTPVDLDRDGLMDVVVCDARRNEVTWIRQYPRGIFHEYVLARDLLAPVHAAAADMTGNGHLDLLVACMGQIFPDNDRIGSVVVLENDGHEHFTKHVIADHIARVTDVEAGDFNGDGRPDLAVAQFGYDQGEVQWMENLGHWHFKSHPLLDLSGAINICVADLCGHGAQDIAVVVSQQWEEIHLFENDGRGHFRSKVLWGSTNQDYGSSGISLCDLNRDGRPDILYSNGDGFGPAVVPGPRPWHGVQWLENLGNGNFKYHRIGDLPGAYSPIGVDLDGDGHMDVVACSAYAEVWYKADRHPVALLWFRNDGHMHFTPHILAYLPKDIITVGAADFTGDGRPDLVTGGFNVNPPFANMGRVVLWTRNSPP